jgi:tetratricopeptide (TPR) repeat protein
MPDDLESTGMKTPYDILGVGRRADKAAIKAALHRTAKRYHPDLHTEDPEAEQHLKEVIAAYQLLKNPQKRAAYDRYLKHRTQRSVRLLRTAFASGSLASAVVIALVAWLWRPQAPGEPGIDQPVVAEAKKPEPPPEPAKMAAPDPSRSPAQERVASREKETEPAAREAPLLAEWARIAVAGDPLVVWAFVARNPQAPEAELARAWLLRLVEATEDASLLSTLSADAGGVLGQHAQQRLDALAHRVSAGAGRKDAGSVAAKGGRQDEASSRDAAVDLERGERRIGAPDLDHAITDVSEAIRIDPSNAVALRDRGALWRRSGAPDRALLDLDQAIRLGFSDAAAYNERGRVWLDKGNYDRAIADFNQALKLDPGLAGAYFNRAAALRGKGDHNAAAADLQLAIRLDPSLAAGRPD